MQGGLLNMNNEMLTILAALVAAQSALLSFVIRWTLNGLTKQIKDLLDLQKKRELEETRWKAEYRVLFREHFNKTEDIANRLEELCIRKKSGNTFS